MRSDNLKSHRVERMLVQETEDQLLEEKEECGWHQTHQWHKRPEKTVALGY